jgi:hypothetical protein
MKEESGKGWGVHGAGGFNSRLVEHVDHLQDAERSPKAAAKPKTTVFFP